MQKHGTPSPILKDFQRCFFLIWGGGGYFLIPTIKTDKRIFELGILATYIERERNGGKGG